MRHRARAFVAVSRRPPTRDRDDAGVARAIALLSPIAGGQTRIRAPS